MKIIQSSSSDNLTLKHCSHLHYPPVFSCTTLQAFLIIYDIRKRLRSLQFKFELLYLFRVKHSITSMNAELYVTHEYE